MSSLDDPQRLRTLSRAGLIEPGQNETFDKLTRVVCEVLGVPVATVTLVTAERQLFTGACGLAEPWASLRETPLEYSFCQHCVLSARPFVVDDARSHPLVKDSPAIEELGVVAYAGVPIVGKDGTVFGTLCAIDHKPRAWSDHDLERLMDLAAAALSEIERRVLEAEIRRRPPADGVEAEGGGAGLNISALAKRTGVAPDTLRKWEQRYGTVHPTRTAGGQRRYSERDVARVEWLRDRLAEGYRISEAAQLLGDSVEPTARTPAKSRAQIFEAIEGDDPGQIGLLLGQSFALNGVERTLTEVVAPLLDLLGEAWAEGRVSVAEEHLASEVIRAHLVQLVADARGPARGVAVLACPQGERHDLGLLMLAILLRADGWQVAYLGADTPVVDVFELAGRLDADVVCFSLAMRDRVQDLEEALREAAVAAHGRRLVLGGRGATAAAAKRVGATLVNGDLRRSVRTIRQFAA